MEESNLRDGLLEEIKSAIASNTCIPVIGAGVAVPGGGITWNELLSRHCNGLPRKFREELDAGLYRVDKLQILSYLQGERRRRGLPAIDAIDLDGPGVLYNQISKWKCRLYISTNYDDGLELALEKREKKHQTLCVDELDKLVVGKVMSKSHDDSVVVKISSTTRKRNPGLITKNDYDDYDRSQGNPVSLLSALMKTYTLVFIGCGMGDPFIQEALKLCKDDGVGYIKPISFLPASGANADPAHIQNLEDMGVRIFDFSGQKNITVELLGYLMRIGDAVDGEKRLLIFEPGSKGRLKKILSAISEINNNQDNSLSSISKVGLITIDKDLDDQFRKWSENEGEVRHITIHSVLVDSIADIPSVAGEVKKSYNKYRWSAMISPYELAIGYAADLVYALEKEHAIKILFHSGLAVGKSRNKKDFQKFLSCTNWNGGGIKPIPSEEIMLEHNDNEESLYNRLSNCSLGRTSHDLVIKPVDAAGSIGVKAINIKDPDSCKYQLRKFLSVINSMPVNVETAGCDVKSILVQQRQFGEEFSVESVTATNQGKPSVLAIHWKIDIDNSSEGFYERLFVSMPEEIDKKLYKKLCDCNNVLLRTMGVGQGVFHAEYRVSDDFQSVYPLEVALRPGGGMVSDSVNSVRGVDLYQCLVRSALSIPLELNEHGAPVATGLVFAKENRAKGGVIPPLGVRLNSGEIVQVPTGRHHLLVTWLQHLVEHTSRPAARQALIKVISSGSNANRRLASQVLEAFCGDESKKLRVKVDVAEIWMEPGALVAEEESTYIAGLRISANEDIENKVEAVAEIIAAMDICLRSIVCEPKAPLAPLQYSTVLVPPGIDDFDGAGGRSFFNVSSHGCFNSDIDSWNYYRALRVRVADVNVPCSLLDIGCGDARPIVQLFRDMAAREANVKYYGVDIDSVDLASAKRNLLKRDGLFFYEADVSKVRWWDGLFFPETIDVVCANLPYLPSSEDYKLLTAVDGGEDGLRLVPGFVIEAANHFKASSIIINISSLCNVERFCEIVSGHGYGVVNIVGTVAPLGSYTKPIADKLQANGFSRIFKSKGIDSQIIVSFILEKGTGISCLAAYNDLHDALMNGKNPVGITAVGRSCW